VQATAFAKGLPTKGPSEAADVSTHTPPETNPDGTGLRLAIVSAQFNHEITGPMRQRANAEAKRLGASVVLDLMVPGTYDLPLVIDHALARHDVDAAVAIGVVITGETGHDEVITQAACTHLTALAIKHSKPVGLGVTGPRQNPAQAAARVDRADWAVRSAIAQFRTLQRIHASHG
jgi:6,7-dimethyl-8-ribityllumazine synthase